MLPVAVWSFERLGFTPLAAGAWAIILSSLLFSAAHYVGPLGEQHEVPRHLFRAYYTDIGVFEVLGERFEMAPILQEVEELHERLLAAACNGSRIPYPRIVQTPST